MSHINRRSVLGLAGAGAAVVVAGAGILGATDLLQGQAHAAEGLNGVDEPKFTELTPFEDPLKVPPTLRPQGTVNIDLVESYQRLHSQLPPTRLWTYQGHFPGPTIEAHGGERFRVAWRNKLKGAIPVKAVWVRPDGPGPGLLPYNRPGSEGGLARPEVDRLTAWTSVHLHGGHQNALDDGAADHAVSPGDTQLAEYANDQAAAHLFYHDHAMAVTSLNVAAGLVGNYLVRDPREDRLDLPGGKYEIPLTIQDVNFDTDRQGHLNGRILAKRIIGHHVQPTPAAMPPALAGLGPYTMVNGVVWPYLEVEARAYRFRMVNVANARIYRLVVVDEQTGAVVRNAMQLIGTDLGLLGKPQTIDEALSLSPAERADIVIDFAAFPGRQLKLVNTIPGQTPGAPLPDFLIPYPQVMQFRVGRKRHAPQSLPATLSPAFRKVTAADLPAGTAERFVVLSLDKAGEMPQIWEMQQVPADTPPGEGIVTVQLPDGLKTLRRTGTVFEDTTTFFAASGTWEKWHFISAAPAGVPIYHPMHVHLMDFQVIDRRAVDASGMNFAAARTERPLTLGAPVPVAAEESGWKDTITVHANTIVTVAGKLARQSGRVMYHCHIFDHEDEGMMRPFVVMPPAVHQIHGMVMAMNGAMGAHHASTHH
ncbi:multicopper oxidase family protein [Catellatospora citrea]|uniref:Multicopper oxidase CueO n=1 Tax=Catellatospora citrea TaxID=53366 RepID=A0A8J3KJG2_9ACTN|nr:multicopper oxidase domain-containing protein [Catellatospora citrea]RKE05383.1 spore coat protein A [Catellatospora citrea]GIF98313.1 multicopper oxidase [Catellatospora citrea]